MRNKTINELIEIIEVNKLWYYESDLSNITKQGLINIIKENDVRWLLN